MNKFMQIEKIVFGKNNYALCALPNDIDELEQTLNQMGLVDRPVIVLIGGHILPEHTNITLQAIEVIAKTAELLDAALICGGTDVGVMAAIGKSHSRNGYQFPLVGISPEGIVTWPEGPRTTGSLSVPGNEREQLESHHSHFILVPGNEFGDESKWIVRAATMIAAGKKSLTVLVNGGKVSQMDVEEGLNAGRPLLVLEGTGRLADNIANHPINRSLIKVVPAHNRRLLAETLKTMLN